MTDRIGRHTELPDIPTRGSHARPSGMTCRGTRAFVVVRSHQTEMRQKIIPAFRVSALFIAACALAVGIFSLVWVTVREDGAGGAVSLKPTSVPPAVIVETENSSIDTSGSALEWDFTFAAEKEIRFVLSSSQLVQNSDSFQNNVLKPKAVSNIWQAREILLFVTRRIRPDDPQVIKDRIPAGRWPGRSYRIRKDPMTGVSVAPDLSQVLFVHNGRVVRMSMTLRDGFPAMDRTTDLGPDFATCDSDRGQVVGAVAIGLWLPGCRFERAGVRFAMDRGDGAAPETHLVARPDRAGNAFAIIPSVGGPVFWAKGWRRSELLEIYPPGKSEPVRFAADRLARMTAWSAQDCTVELWTDATPDRATRAAPILRPSIEGWSRIRVDVCQRTAASEVSEDAARLSFLESMLNFSSSIVAEGQSDARMAVPAYSTCERRPRGCMIGVDFDPGNKLALLWDKRQLERRADVAVWFPGGPFTDLETVLNLLDLPELHWSNPGARPAMFVALGPESFSGTVAARAPISPDPTKRAAALKDMLDRRTSPNRQGQAFAMIAGDSFGGLTASSFALTYPRFARRLVLIGPGTSRSIMRQDHAAIRSFISGDPGIQEQVQLGWKAAAPFIDYIASMASGARSAEQIPEVCALLARNDDVVEPEDFDWYIEMMSSAASKIDVQRPDHGGHGLGAARACL